VFLKRYIFGTEWFNYKRRMVPMQISTILDMTQDTRLMFIYM